MRYHSETLNVIKENISFCRYTFQRKINNDWLSGSKIFHRSFELQSASNWAFCTEILLWHCLGKHNFLRSNRRPHCTALTNITSNTYWAQPLDLSVIKVRLMRSASRRDYHFVSFHRKINNQPLKDVMVNPVSFHWAKIASLKTYHIADNILSQSTPCLAGLEWSDCRCQTKCHKKHIWSTPFSHTATCVGGQGGVRKRGQCKSKTEERSMRERVREGKEENSMSMTLHICELTGNHTANQPYS